MSFAFDFWVLWKRTLKYKSLVFIIIYRVEGKLVFNWEQNMLAATSIPILSRKTSKWRFRFKPWKCQVWLNIFLLQNILHRYHGKQSNCKRPSYYTMINLFTKIENTTLKIQEFSFHNNLCVSHMALQTASLNNEAFKFCSRMFWPVCASLTVGNFELIWNMAKILVRILHYNNCDRT